MIQASILHPMAPFGRVLEAWFGPTNLSVALGGLGAIGFKVARELDKGIPGLSLTAISAHDREGALACRHFAKPPPVMPLDTLSDHADVVVECAPASVFEQVAVPAIEAGCIFMPVVCGSASSTKTYHVAQETGARIIIPTGALIDSMQCEPQPRETSNQCA